MCQLGTMELVLILLVVLLLFGASRLPQLGKAVGETLRAFKKAQSSPERVSEAKPNEVAPHEVARLVEKDAEQEKSPALPKKEP